MTSQLSVTSPVYFGVSVWGRSFCESFVQYALASLLAQGNIPALDNHTGKNTFLIYTAKEDWDWLQQQALIKELQRYMLLEWLPMSDLTEEAYNTLNNGLRSHKLYLMTLGHREIVNKMHANKAIGSVVIPDSIYSDHAISSAFKYIEQGKQSVLVFCPRFSTDGVLKELYENHDAKHHEVLSIPARQLVKAATQHLHIDMRMQAWKSPYLPEFMLETYWPLPNDNGMLFHTWTCWCAFINYATLSVHRTESLEHNTIDGVYFGDNLTTATSHFIQDSDEFTLISFSPELDRKLSSPRFTLFLQLLKIAFAKRKLQYVRNMQTDDFKLSYATQPIYIHHGDLTSDCLRLNEKTTPIIEKILGGKLTNLDRVLLFMNEPNIWAKIKGKIKGKIKSILERSGCHVFNKQI